MTLILPIRRSILLTCQLGIVIFACSVQAATIVVTTTVDELDNGACLAIDYSPGTGISLTEALCFTNNNGDASNIITLPAGTYTMSRWGGESGIPTTGTLTINGAGVQNTIIQGNDNPGIADKRLLSVASGSDVTLNNMTLRNGRLTSVNGGGAIENLGSLTIANCAFSGNRSANGGAIYSAGPLLISSSTFSSNSVNDYGGGGAVFISSGTASISNSTFFGNGALGDGEGNGGNGGGILNGGTLNLLNVTISANSVTGSGKGGGIVNGGTLNYTNTIITNSSGADCYNFGTIGTNAANLVKDGTCSPSLSGDPMLGPLANNGGPTMTMELLRTPTLSPAIDTGTNAGCPATDQRGRSRPKNLICDIGAFEAETELILSNGFESS